MTGGLMNLNATGNENIILNGNPKKTFFKATYNKFTNFGMQKFRLDYEGQRRLSMTKTTVFNFKIPSEYSLKINLILNFKRVF